MNTAEDAFFWSPQEPPILRALFCLCDTGREADPARSPA